MKTALVCGSSGFIGTHLVKKLKSEGYEVTGIDLKWLEFSEGLTDHFEIGDLRNSIVVHNIMQDYDEVYQLAADMGGAGYIFTGEHDADVMTNSALINLNIAYWAMKIGVKKLFYSSSACVYPEFNQIDSNNPVCIEYTAYPAQPDSEYGWEKLFSERLYKAYQRNYDLDVRIARFHNIFGPEGSWNNGKEKAPAAICRKVAEAKEWGEIEIWGDGEQTRSFMFIDECLEGIQKLMEAEKSFDPINIGSEEMISINDLVKMVARIANKNVIIKHIDGPQGVRGRCSDNYYIEKCLGWKPSYPLELGMKQTYAWIKQQVDKNI